MTVVFLQNAGSYDMTGMSHSGVDHTEDKMSPDDQISLFPSNESSCRLYDNLYKFD